MNPLTIFGSIVSGVTGFFTRKQEIKKATVTAKAKLDQARLNGEHTLEMTDAEWESLSVQTQNNSWKDEYITIIITVPIVFILIGSVMSALGMPSGEAVVNGSLEGITRLKELGMDYGLVLNAVVFAAVGLKLWRA